MANVGKSFKPLDFPVVPLTSQKVKKQKTSKNVLEPEIVTKRIMNHGLFLPLYLLVVCDAAFSLR